MLRSQSGFFAGPPARSAALVALVTVALATAACETTRNLMPDQLPTVTLTSGPIDTVSVRQSWLVDIAWTGNDPDGSIDHYEYALDPPGLRRAQLALAETSWVKTNETHVVARFHASHPDTLGVGATASEFHVFVLRAVDNRGGNSPDVVRAFYAYTVAPDVQITHPIPNLFLRAQIPLPAHIDWQGHDPDGTGSGRPAFYRYHFVPLDDFNTVYLSDPDSLLREGFRTGWDEWQTVSADTTSLEVPESAFVPGRSVALAVLAVDEAGATTPYLMLDRNFLQFTVTFPGAGAPRIHIWSSVIDFTYPSGGYSLDPLREIPVELPANRGFTFQWDGIASPGRQVVSTRWMLDGDPSSEAPRSGPDDVHHWSEPVAPPGVASIPGLLAGTHRLYIEVTDDFGDKSLGIVRITTFNVSLQSELLVVDDTRLEADKFPSGTGGPGVYTQPWPSAAELDTFLYARGGVPWRGTKNPTTGVISPPGLLAGYPFDTLGTRLGLENPALGVRLSQLGRYRHVVWIVDAHSSQFGQTLDQGLFPTTVLRAISAPGVANTLAEYIQLGGQVWLAGGGTAYASLVAFDRRTNNIGQMTVFTVRDGELGPGRPMYDAAHVRSALGVLRSGLQVSRSPAAVGGWSGHGPDGTLSAPDYSHAPAAMRPRDPGTDPVPPTRLPAQASLYYPTAYPAGCVLEPNNITEDFDPDPAVERIESALDTVYDVSGAALPIPSAPVMLYYHGRENAPFVYTGFEPWDYTRDDCQGLVDFVLGDIWKLTKSPGASARPMGSPARVQRPAAPRLSAGLDPRRMRP